MGAIQIIVIALMTLELGHAMAKHGEPNGKKHNFWVSLLSAITTAGLLAAGGFFTNCN